MEAEKKRKKPGPPPSKGKDPPRSIRVPNEEWMAWKRYCAARGVSVSMWLRQMANQRLGRKPKPLNGRAARRKKG